MGDNSNIDQADKIISLSKIDNNNLTKFVQTLQSHQVKIFQHQTNPFARKRVLLLGNPKWRICHLCFAKFLSEDLLLNHLNTEHKENCDKPVVNFPSEESMKCSVCSKTFNSHIVLKKHSKWCVNFPCPHCSDNKKFPCTKLLEHTQTMHGDKFPFKCLQCKQQFDEYKSYEMHKCTTFHKCSKCNKTFPTSDSLEHHAKKYKDVQCNLPSRNCPICKNM